MKNNTFSPSDFKIIYSRASDHFLYIKNSNDISIGEAITTQYGNFPTVSPDNTKIAYINSNSESGTVHIKNSNDGLNGTSLSINTRCILAYSPDGNYIIYANNGPLYRMNTSTYVSEQITTIGCIYGCCYSPDGNYIVYAYNNGTGGHAQLYKKNANDTSNGTAITPSGAFPRYTPDGNYIVYIYNGTIYKKNANDTDIGIQLTTDSVSYGLDVSSDGNYVIYTNGSKSNTLYIKDINVSGNGTSLGVKSTASPCFINI